MEILKAMQTIFVLQEALVEDFKILQIITEKGIPIWRVICEHRIDECFV